MPMIAASAISAGGSLLGGVLGSSSAKKAAREQAKAMNKATRQQQDALLQARKDQAPYRYAGYGALNELTNLLGITPQTPQGKGIDTFDDEAYLSANPDVAASSYANNPYQHYLDWGAKEGRQATYRTTPAEQPAVQGPRAGFGSLMKSFGMEDFQADPGYQFRLAEGNKALSNSAAARGNLLSGAALKAASKYNQNVAAEEYGNAYNRFNTDKANKFNPLASLAGVGQTATNAVGQQSLQTAQQIGSNIGAGANAQAAGIVGGANAWGNAIGQGVSSYQNNQLLKQLQANQAWNSGGQWDGSWANWGK